MNLFATPLWANQLEQSEGEPLNHDLLAFFEAVRIEQGVRAGAQWQTPNDLQKRPQMAAFLDIVRRYCLQTLDELKVQSRAFSITGCWANFNPPGGTHPAHTHPNNYLSGVYYVSAPQDGGRIVFHDPRQQPYIVSPQTTEPNAYNSGSVHLDVYPGMLLLFPSWLMHSVEANNSHAARVSISFNMMFEDFAATIASPNWTP